MGKQLLYETSFLLEQQLRDIHTAAEDWLWKNKSEKAWDGEGVNWPTRFHQDAVPNDFDLRRSDVKLSYRKLSSLYFSCYYLYINIKITELKILQHNTEQ